MSQSVPERINQLRRLIHIHSLIYYHYHTQIVLDHKFDEWSAELVFLMDEYPEYLDVGYQADMFKDWTGETGMHLPITEWARNKAWYLIERYMDENGVSLKEK